jgi:aminoglycoside phosphotransferase (APT) family kinase protein
VYCSKDEFTPLIKEIFKKEGLEFKKLENCKPGTNGVFRVGKYIAKVFVPLESGYDSMPDYKAELFALERANLMGISVPKLIANGQVEDRYLFRYLIMDFVEGETLGDIKCTLTKKQKMDIGEQLRYIVQSWATPCENFNGIDVIQRTLNSKRWQDAPTDIREAQKRYLENLKGEPFVYVHGDLTEDNLIIGSSGEITVVDFADSLCAPAIYEDMAMICDAFSFDKDFLKGYYRNYNSKEIVEICLNAILCHEYGYHVVKNIFGPVNSYDELSDRIRGRIAI